ncbi:MAG: hypothetical protein IKE28_02310 [Solobacterium sp.]|nr:hypothetical protein [Solobacterium sp.]
MTRKFIVTPTNPSYPNMMLGFILSHNPLIITTDLYHNNSMARPHKDYDQKEFLKLYNRWERNLLTQQEMATLLGISRATLARRLSEYRHLETVETIRRNIFLDPNVVYNLDSQNLADAVQLLSALKTNSIGAAVYDPEYRTLLDHLAYGNEGHAGSRQRKRVSLPQMSDDDIQKHLHELYRVLKPSGYCFLWTDQYSLLESLPTWLKQTNFEKVGLVTWDKGRSGSGWRVRHKAEYLVILQKEPSVAKWVDHSIPDIWLERVKKKVHPHSKPIYLITRLILVTTTPGDVILDPAAGGYSTLAACKKAGLRHFIGCDLLPAPSALQHKDQ